MLESDHTDGLETLTDDQLKAIQFESNLILDLNEVWLAHKAQQEVLHAIFYQGKKIIFIECGRKFGKTDFLNYILHRICAAIPNAAAYFIAPLLKQAKELVWANNRLQHFFLPNLDPKTGLTVGGRDKKEATLVYEHMKAKYYKSNPNNTEMRQRFLNESFYKLDGSDSYEAYRGVNPHVIVYDEFKDHHPKFHDGMEPNLATYNAINVVVGTPPEGDEPNAQGFYNLAELAKRSPRGAYFNYSSYENPHISKDWLDQKKEELLMLDKEDTWLREYMAKRVRGGSRSIFPMLEVPEKEKPHTAHVRPHKELDLIRKKHRKDWDYFFCFDPASATTFGCLFIAINRIDKRVLVLDEIYEQKKAQMHTTSIMERALEIIKEHSVLYEDVRLIYDNAATWFSNEVADKYGYSLEPCMKDVKSKEVRLNLIKELLIFKYCKISDRCLNFLKEMEGYRVDEKGKIPKENDHLIDCFRYILAACYYNTLPERVEASWSGEDGPRFVTPHNDPENKGNSKDPFSHLTEELYE